MLSLVQTPRQRAAPDIAAPAIFGGVANSRAAWGVADPDVPTVAQQRTAYRGLVATLARLRADAVTAAMTAAEVHRETRPGEFEPVQPTEPWPTLLRTPHPTYSPRALWHWAQQAKDLGRGAFFRVERDRRGVPLYLHPVFPVFGDVSPIGGPSGEIAAYLFLRSDGRQEVWEARDVVWLRHPHPVSPYESASLLEIAAYTADANLWQSIYARDIAKRGGAPQLQVTTDQELQPNDIRELGLGQYRKVYDQHTHKTLPVYGKGAKLLPIGLDPKDMEMLETRRFTREELYDIFGVPLGLKSEGATYSNANQAARTFAKWCVQPEADANCDLLTMDLRVAYEAPGVTPTSTLCVVPPDVEPADPEFELRRDEVYLRTGRRTLNEYREEDGAKTYGEPGDVPLVSGLLVPLETVAAPPQPVPAALAVGVGVEPADGDEAEEEPEEEPARSVSPVLRMIGRMRAAGTYRMDDDTLAAEWRAIDAEKREAERTVEAVAASLLRRMGEETVQNLREAARGARREGEPVTVSASAVFNFSAWAEEVVEELGGPILRALASGWASGAARLSADLTFQAATPGVRQAVREITAKTRSVPETALGMLETAVRDGMLADEDLAQMTARVSALFEDLADWQARRIARTAGHGAFEAGQVEAFAEAGVEEKRWLSERDARVRPEHDALDGEQVPVRSVFSNGLAYPSEPNCRCTVLPVTAARSLSERDAWIVAEYARRVDGLGRGVTLSQLEDEIAGRVESDGWAPIGQRQILRIAKGHD
jgi:SPP1 gp7 family putative phage head morphogenesis protein